MPQSGWQGIEPLRRLHPGHGSVPLQARDIRFLRPSHAASSRQLVAHGSAPKLPRHQMQRNDGTVPQPQRCSPSLPQMKVYNSGCQRRRTSEPTSGAAASIDEEIEQTLTLHRLRLFAELRGVSKLPQLPGVHPYRGAADGQERLLEEQRKEAALAGNGLARYRVALSMGAWVKALVGTVAGARGVQAGKGSGASGDSKNREKAASTRATPEFQQNQH